MQSKLIVKRAAYFIVLHRPSVETPRSVESCPYSRTTLMFGPEGKCCVVCA